jgi:hypothetical protein
MSLIDARPTRIRKQKIIPGQSQTMTTNTFQVVVKSNTLNDTRAIMQKLILDGTSNQMRLGNNPERLTVDGSDTKNMALVKKNIVVTFQDSVPLELIDAIERNLMSFIASSPVVDDKFFGDSFNGENGSQGYKNRIGKISAWEWVFIPPKNGAKVGNRKGARVADPRKSTSFPQDSVWVLKPAPGNTESGVANVAAFWMTDQRASRAKGGYDTIDGKGRVNTGVRITSRSTTKRGFIAQTTASVKRLKAARSVTIWGGYTKKYPVKGEQWFPDWMWKTRAKAGVDKLTPYIMIKARSKRSNGNRGYQTEGQILKRMAKQAYRGRVQ